MRVILFLCHKHLLAIARGIWRRRIARERHIKRTIEDSGGNGARTLARDMILQMWYNARYAEDMMCGIAGIVYNEAGQAIADGRTGKIGRMLSTIKYRGPDDSGEYYFDRCALGHVRLSIVDLTGGKQPMIWPSAAAAPISGARAKLGIVFNGEIYGYKEIRASLANATEHGGGVQLHY